MLERKRWAKYGASKNDGPGPSAATTILCDEENMQFLSKDLNATPEADPLQQIKEKGAFVKCRYCQENHFTAKCPYKDSGLELMSRELEEPKKVGLFRGLLSLC